MSSINIPFGDEYYRTLKNGPPRLSEAEKQAIRAQLYPQIVDLPESDYREIKED